MITKTKYFREKYIRACVALYGMVHEQRVQQLFEIHMNEKLDLTTQSRSPLPLQVAG